VTQTRRYRYVGPAELRDQVVAVDAVAVDAPASLHGWLAGRDCAELAEPFTFVVALDGMLRLAPRRSEHVVLAGGRDVLAAGEMAFAPAGTGWCVAEVTNQSTGYCPDLHCWPAVARALDRAGIRHPDNFTNKVIFRRCPTCGERNIVRDDDFTCALCNTALPASGTSSRTDQHRRRHPVLPRSASVCSGTASRGAGGASTASPYGDGTRR
jgi:hypothetical protein